MRDQRVTKEDLLLNSWYTYLRLNNFSYENRDCVVGFGRYLIVFWGIRNNSLKVCGSFGECSKFRKKFNEVTPAE